MLDIPHYFPKFLSRPNPMIVAFILPKGSLTMKNPIRTCPRESLQWTQPTCVRKMGSHQQVHMVRHHDKRVQIVALELFRSITNSLRDHTRHGNLRKIPWATPRPIQQPVHRCKLLTRTQVFLQKHPTFRQASQQPKGDEYGLTDRIPMRQPPLVMSHKRIVPRAAEVSHSDVGQGLRPAKA